MNQTIMLMSLVERAVRPLHASTPRKRKIREELLAHVAAIYEEEQARRNDPDAAVRETERRFGDPAGLARELEKVLPASERSAYHLERWFGWRAPESAARYTGRVALQLFVALVIPFGLLAIPLVMAAAGQPWDGEAWRSLRSATAFVLLMPVAQFVLGLLYFRTRDSLWGAFGTRASRLKACGYAALFALVVQGILLGFLMFATWDRSMAAALRYPGCLVALACAGGCLLCARFRGPIEICDTHWACLDIETRFPIDPPPPDDAGAVLELA